MQIGMRQNHTLVTIRALYHGRDRASRAAPAGTQNRFAMASSTVPRRWSTELDGVRWLPRLIDKARMQQRGELGSYLLGHSPVDHALLTRMNLTTEQFADIVRQSPDDAAVLDRIRAHGWDEARVRRWSARFTSTYRTYIVLWDLDEGYVRPNALQAVGLAAFKPLESTAMALVRRVRRAP